MKLSRFLVWMGLGLVTFSMSAESKNPADYPLRIHVYGRNQTTFYHGRVEEEAKGEGRANLFSDDGVRGVDFTFDCDQKLRASMGPDAYPAKWKKPGQELVVLMPVFGRSGQYFTCRFKTDVKDFVYFVHNHQLATESPDRFKEWMAKHDYDPVHGKMGQPNDSPDAEAEARPPVAPKTEGSTRP